MKAAKVLVNVPLDSISLLLYLFHDQRKYSGFKGQSNVAEEVSLTLMNYFTPSAKRKN